MKTHLNNVFLLPLVAALGLILTGPATAQTFTTLHSFTEGIDGVSLQAGLVLSGNVLYGTTEYGGPSGNNSTLFAVNINGSGFRIVYNFSAEAINNLGFNTNSDAGGTDGTLVLSGNTLYGASYEGGTNGTGAVFAVNTNGTFTLLHSFSAAKTNPATGLFTNSDGYGSEAGLILSGGTLFGTTEHGGTSGYGVVFKVNTNGTGFVNLHNFTNGSDGTTPEGLLLQSNFLYGVACGFNTTNAAVFKLNTNGTGFTTLHSFPGLSLGMALSGNTLYGIGGSPTNGGVFAIQTDGTGFTNLYTFTATSGPLSTNRDGAQTIDNGGLVLSGNTLYGTAYYGGNAGNGTVFAVNTNGSGFITLHSFTAESSGINNDGANPYSGLTLSGNTLFGTAKAGGTNGDGTVFNIYLGLAATTTSLPNGTNGVAYNQILAAFGGQTPYTWTNSSGALPPGLMLATNGVISGTPTNNGIFNFIVKVTDALSETTTQSLALTVVAFQVTTTALPNGTNGFGYNQQLSAVNGQLPFSWSLISGSLPSGLTLATNGLISGTPTTSGTFNFIVQVTDALSVTATQSLTLTVASLQVTTVELTNGTNGVAYSQQLSAANGQPPYNWSLISGSLPSGLTLAANGLIYGTPTGDEIVGFTVRVTDALSMTATEPLMLTVSGSIITNYLVFKTIHNFTNGSDGNDPDCGLVLSGNTLYGTTTGAGTGNATLFNVRIDGTRFTSTSIGDPGRGPLVLSGNTLYGITLGDYYGSDILFKVNINGTGYTQLLGFAPSSLILSSNTLYGTTSGDNLYSAGTVFKVNTDGSGFTNLYSFDFYDGYSPGSLVLSGNTLYGTTGKGIFAVNTDGSGFTNLYSISGTGYGGGQNGLVLSGKTLYGTTYFGGSGFNGMVFAANTNGSGITILHNFAAGIVGNQGQEGTSFNSLPVHNSDGAGPCGGLILSGSTLYGTTFYGGSSSCGTVFAVNTNGSGFTNLYFFTGGDGANPYAGVIISNNTLYGTTYDGGSSGYGTVFSLYLGTPLQYTANPTNGPAPLTVQFTSPSVDTGGNALNHWNWSFGDGLTSTVQNPSHVYASAGTFQPSFVASNSLGFIVYGSGLAITAVLPTVQYTARPTNGFVSLTVQFTSPGVDSNSNVITNWNWKFGDGLTSTAQNPLHVYTSAGTFQPSFVASNSLGFAVYGSGPAITVALPPPSVAIQPTNNSVAVTVGNNVIFAVSVVGAGPFSYQWQLNGTNLPNGIITTVAGGGDNYPGDGGAATNAELAYPQGVAVDATGNLFIADMLNNVIRKVGTNGIITTVAGNGINDYSGDGGAATNAELNYPWGVAVDTTDNLFIADQNNNRVRKVGTNGIISTVAGNGTNNYSGDGGAATNAELYWPLGAAVDATGNLYIADYGNSCIREVDTSGIINTVAGSGTNYPGDGDAATNAGLSGPYGVAVDAIGNLFIADPNSNLIRKVGTNGIITTAAGNGDGAGTGGYGDYYSGDGGAATNAELNLPQGVTVDATGNLFIADWGNNVIREVGTNGIITTVAGGGANGLGDGGAATNADLFPVGVAVDATGNLFIADLGNRCIRKVVIQGPTLVLNNVGLGNAGAYDVVVSSPYGSVTSSNVNLTIIVPLQITTTSLPNGTNGTAYSHTLIGSGGQTPYSWTNISGALPPGLKLATNGVISGTPTTAGTFKFVVKVTDALSNTATQALSLIVFGPPIVAIQPTNSSLTIPFGNNVTLSVSVTGTSPFSYQWQLNGTNLPNGPNGIITTVAGGYVGEGVPATNASLKASVGLVKDKSGNLWIADTGHQLIRKLGANGIITTVAGNGNSGYSGDGGPATNASFNNPAGLAMDAAGNLFIAEGNNVVRRVDTNGIITTVAGGGPDYPGDGEAATNVSMWNPAGVTVDSAGNLFIAVMWNNVVRRVDTHGVITTVAGNGTNGYSGDGGAATNASLNNPSGVAVDAAGNLFIADGNNYRVRVVDTNGNITTMAGGGTNYPGDGGMATNASLGYPWGVSVDAARNVYIADSWNNIIRRVDAQGIITTPAGGGPDFPGDGEAATNVSLNNPEGVTVDAAGNLFIADTGNSRIRQVDAAGTINTVAGGYLGVDVAATNASLDNPEGVALDAFGNLYISDSNNQLIRKVGSNGIITTVAGNGINSYGGDFGAATNASLSAPDGVAVDAFGHLFIADAGNSVIRQVDNQGLITTVAGNGPDYPGDGEAATNAGLWDSCGVAVDSTGDLFIAEYFGNRIRKVGINGIISTAAGNGNYGYSGDGGAATNASIANPTVVTTDASSDLFIADTGNSLIRKVDTAGIISTVAGGGPDYPGDGETATNVSLNNPQGVTVDVFGNLFIADTVNNVIRRVDAQGFITTVAGNYNSAYSGDGGAATNASIANPLRKR